MGAVAANFQTGDDNVKAAIPLNLTLQPIKQITFEFGNLAAAQARHVNVVALRTPLVEVFLALHVHQVEFVDQAMPL